MKIHIIPKRPVFFLSIATIIMLISFMPIFVNDADFKVLIIMSTVVFCFSIAIFRLIDKQFLLVSDNGNGDIEIKGYLGIRRIKLKKTDFKGYEVQQRLDQVKGTQNVWILVTKRGKKILFAEGAYENYHELVKWIEENFEFLSYKEMKYAKFMGKSYVYMTIIGGVIYFLLAIIKLLKLM